MRGRKVYSVNRLVHVNVIIDVFTPVAIIVYINVTGHLDF